MLSDKWMIRDSQWQLKPFVEKLKIRPFKETVSVFLVRPEQKDGVKNWEIAYYLDLDNFVNSCGMSNVSLKSEVVLTAIRVALKLNYTVLFAHTHPPVELFPKEWEVYDDKGFSGQDFVFMDRVNELFLLEQGKKFSDCIESRPIFYLVIEEGSYCALAYIDGKYSKTEMPELESKGFRISDWEVEEYEEKVWRR